MFSGVFWLAVGQIIMIDVLLGGDNAVVIALACRRLPPAQRRRGILWGTAGAIALRIVLIFFALTLLAIPFLKVIGALLLLWIGVKLLSPENEGGHAAVEGSDKLWDAVKTVIVADFVMSLDNVIAIAGAAEASGTGHGMVLVIFGVLVSIPIIVFGSQMVIKLMERFPIIITLGGMLLGWIAGTMLVSDPVLVDPKVMPSLPKLGSSDALRYGAGVAGALLVLALGKWMVSRAALPQAPRVAAQAFAAGPLRSLLLAVDGSEAAGRATQQAVALLRGTAGPAAPKLHLVHVQRPVSGDVSSFLASGTLDDYYREQSEAALAASKQMLDAASVSYEVHPRVGVPGEEIVRQARESGCDLIVMGTKGVGAAAALLGSVVQSTLEESEVPVLLVR